MSATITLRFCTELKRRTGRALEGDAEESGFELGGIKVLFEDRRKACDAEKKTVIQHANDDSQKGIMRF